MLAQCVTISVSDLLFSFSFLGCSIWLGELTREFPPSTKFDGFDISDLQYPPRDLVWAQYDVVEA